MDGRLKINGALHMSSIVYVLSNEAMPNLVKIGIATDINERARQLYSTGVPLPFTCEYAGVVENASQVEKALHFAFGHNRLHDRSEFFEIEPSQAIVLLKLLFTDEATAALGVHETAVVAELIGELKKQGLGIFLISHDTREMMELCDQVSVMKNGQMVGAERVEGVTEDDILSMIILGKNPKEAA